jgi:hypothetical protein
MNLQEKFDAYELLALGVKAKEIIENYRKQTNTNAQ